MTETRAYVVQALEAAFDGIVGHAQAHPAEFPQENEHLYTDEHLLRQRAYDFAVELFGEGSTIADRLDAQLTERLGH